MEAQTVTTAKTAESSIACSGRAVSARAARPARELADPDHTQPGEHQQSQKRIDAEQVGRRGAGERAERQRVRRKGCVPATRRPPVSLIHDG